MEIENTGSYGETQAHVAKDFLSEESLKKIRKRNLLEHILPFLGKEKDGVKVVRVNTGVSTSGTLIPNSALGWAKKGTSPEKVKEGFMDTKKKIEEALNGNES